MGLIKPIKAGVELPELTNPATAENIQTGFEAVDGEGNKITGTHEEAEIPTLPTLTNAAAAGDILTGKESINGDGNKITGSMVNRGAVSSALNAGSSYTIPAGYHNGAGKVTANSLASQTSATAGAGNIASGKTAWVNGAKVTGTHSCPTLASMTTDATATAADIMSGKTAYVKGAKVTGEAVAGAEYEEIAIAAQSIPTTGLTLYHSLTRVSHAVSTVPDVENYDGLGNVPAAALYDKRLYFMGGNANYNLCIKKATSDTVQYSSGRMTISRATISTGSGIPQIDAMRVLLLNDPAEAAIST